MLALLPVMAAMGADVQPSPVERGAALFSGAEAIGGKIRGHEFVLPARALRCSNCHASVTSPAPLGIAAPRLDARFLIRPRQRRGGPPTSYDQASFCRVLREAVDPGYILLAREMPLYEIDDEQCASLWQFLTSKGASHAGTPTR